MMKISVITVMLNSEATLLDTIHSVNAQTYPDIEQVFVDGGSSDRSVQIANENAQKPHILISEPDDGLYDAMNKGIKRASGDVIAFLNSDDVYAKNEILSQAAKIFEDDSVDAVYGDLVYVKYNDTNTVRRYWKSGPFKEDAFLKGWLPPHPTFMCRKKLYHQFGSFDTTFKIASDYELMFRFIQRHKIKMAYLPKVFVKMRTGGASNTPGGIIKANLEVFRAFRQNGYPVHWRASVMKPVSKIGQYFKKPPSE
ncbi:MAG: glycosyltransferase family 2 protein [Planctomycetota bacterium]|jgi:glycosyltransferase